MPPQDRLSARLRVALRHALGRDAGADPAAGEHDGRAASRASVLGAVADSSHDAIFSLDPDGVVRTASARSELVLGYSERRLTGRKLSTITVDDDARDQLDGLVRAAARGKDVFQHDTMARTRDGRVVDVTINLAPLRPVGGEEVVGVSVIIQDITGRKQLERRLREQAERDALTGVFNRRRFEADLHREVRLAARHEHAGGVVLLLDVDDFKRVNDTWGHAGGDDLLRTVAHELTTSLRDTDLVARLGGDEFAALATNVEPAARGAIADKVLAGQRRSLARWGATVSVGTAHFAGGHRESASEILAVADAALYAAKAAGGDRAARPGRDAP
jgi:diguanylate cyclase (GGDEF)-like protein/PAS domain S-box-containing protein